MQSMQQRNTILCDIDPESIDNLILSKNTKIDLSQMIRGNDMSFGEYYMSNLVMGRTVVDDLIASISKVAERCDKLDGITFYSSFKGSIGTLGIDRLRQSFPKTKFTYISIFPDAEKNTTDGPAATYNFP